LGGFISTFLPNYAIIIFVIIKIIVDLGAHMKAHTNAPGYGRGLSEWEKFNVNHNTEREQTGEESLGV
jgi:hypothetical protein